MFVAFNFSCRTLILSLIISLGQLWAMDNLPPEQPTVKLRLNDGSLFNIPMSTARMSGTLEQLLDGMDVDRTKSLEQEIPLYNIDKKNFILIVECLKNIKALDTQKNKPNIFSIKNIIKNAFYKENVSPDHLDSFYAAVEFLNIQVLIRPIIIIKA